MRVEVKLPTLGENIDRADISAVRVQVGQRVQKEETLLEVEADKATVEVPSPSAGVITELFVQQGTSVSAGHLVMVLETEDVAAPTAEPARVAPKTTPAPVAAPPVQAAPAPAVPAPVTAAVIAEPLREPTPSRITKGLQESEAASQVARVLPEARKPVGFVSPSVRRLARELGVDVGAVASPRLTEDDVKRAAREGGRSAEPAGKPLPDLSKFGPIEREPMSKVRKATAEAMSLAWRTIPHVTLFHEADAGYLEDVRSRFAPAFEKEGLKLTVTALLLRIVASALEQHGRLNAAIDLERQEIVLRKSIHLGVAVDTPKGLLVPVLRDAQTKSVKTIARELAELATRARAGKLSLDEMQGATFSVTNLGGLGTGFFTPIINPPEVAILGVGRIQKRFDGTKTVQALPLSLSFDHRAVDGADGARFMTLVTEACRDPIRLLLG